MSQKHECPVKYFSGYVLLPDYMNYEQLIMWKRTARDTRKLFENSDSDDPSQWVVRPDVLLDEFRQARLPGILLCVEEWHLAHMPEQPTVKTFPATPEKAANRLYTWLRDLVDVLYSAEETEAEGDSPNA